MTVRYNTILVAVDGSDESKRALRKAMVLAKDHGAKLLLAHIIETLTTAAPGPGSQAVFPEVDEKAINMLKEYKELAEKEGVTDVKEILDYGSPKVKIAKDVAKKYHVNLIVTGAAGLNAVEKFLIGSVSQHITRHAACDVLVVRSETEDK
ncbi:universal stress protein [Alkalicoccus halolimnae]|uniref:Universal stress protein n=1 Tax=Alkalicoccus halolimnae TaxID=1667239 RepID=A0A5C7F7E0_9BACI|nr:universal stress protein [Alkalicoccus halolimnae]TXF85318.1 universal stress protein [Alkalicoccus halolimnae]